MHRWGQMSTFPSSSCWHVSCNARLSSHPRPGPALVLALSVPLNFPPVC